MEQSTRSRLSMMMFLQYAIGGLVLPILSHYLKNHLEFAPLEVGNIMAMPAVAAIVGPILMVYVADQVLSAERLLALCHAVAGMLMLALARQTEYGSFLLLYFAYGMFFAPTFALTNAVAFHHVKDAKRDFGGIRMWGPMSWVAVALSFSFLWLSGEPASAPGSRLSDALVFSALLSLALAAYALTLPQSAVAKTGTQRIPPWKAISVFMRPGMAVLCGLAFLNAVAHQLYYFGMSPYLSQIGFANAYIMPVMSMGQVGEVVMMVILGAILGRLTIKQALFIGVLAQAVRAMAFATGSPILTMLLIPSHGICYALFFTTAYIYVDTHCSSEVRSGAQQLFNVLIAGLGTLSGNLISGTLGQLLTKPGSTAIDFHYFWIASALLSIVIAALLLLFFKEEPVTRA